MGMTLGQTDYSMMVWTVKDRWAENVLFLVKPEEVFPAQRRW